MKVFSELFQYLDNLIKFINYYEEYADSHSQSMFEFKFVAISSNDRNSEGFILLYKANRKLPKLLNGKPKE